MNKSKNTYHPIKVILLIITFLFLFLMEQLPLSILTLTKKELGANYSSYISYAPLLTLILLAISTIILIFVFKHAQKFPTQKFTKGTWMIVVIATVLTMVINFATVPFMRSSNENVDALKLVANNNMVILILFTIFVAPILEEILFRGILMNWFFVDRPFLAILLSGIVFGYVHAPFSANTDWIYALSKILLGVVLAGVYYRTKNIKADITVHFLNNILAILGGTIISGAVLL
ncbi:CPBP family intramembrane glutamic endopeptidase [Companilactobacillus halodurans]|uniref:CPBP family intramembrane metalloprotease n=1 Tax=Companilactobacillus halodurans TaxID=2584183 RepID=A0A5P0ZXQ3_9LACO|nr:type II CAAX endopeptidase family protein [Companilactobacillus halodurans]MQS75000.1 CPBP family intramembrane metalloprotease [Companilactobacillus halodurans]MQS97876.1 CPBP family intramembrane metalloprotease [Companilactobacillus halodurans]